MTPLWREAALETFMGVTGPASAVPERARHLEPLGYDGLGLGDHLLAGSSRHVFAALGAAAVSTERVRLLSSFANNLLRHPLELAHAAITLAALSGGRFEIGIGTGWTAAELARLGRALPPPRERVDRLVEAAPGVAVGIGVFAAAGHTDQVRSVASSARDGLQRDLIGEPVAVADTLAELEALGIDRVNVTPMTDDTPDLLGPCVHR